MTHTLLWHDTHAQTHKHTAPGSHFRTPGSIALGQYSKKSWIFFPDSFQIFPTRRLIVQEREFRNPKANTARSWKPVAKRPLPPNRCHWQSCVVWWVWVKEKTPQWKRQERGRGRREEEGTGSELCLVINTQRKLYLSLPPSLLCLLFIGITFFCSCTCCFVLESIDWQKHRNFFQLLDGKSE